jgi:hypothetical protein
MAADDFVGEVDAALALAILATVLIVLFIAWKNGWLITWAESWANGVDFLAYPFVTSPYPSISSAATSFMKPVNSILAKMVSFFYSIDPGSQKTNIPIANPQQANNSPQLFQPLGGLS